MSEMSQGIVLLAIGMVVLLILLVVLVLSIELIVWYDNKMHARRMLKESEQAAEDPMKVAPEVVAAIGMALHEYFQAQSAQLGISALERRRMTVLASLFWRTRARSRERRNGRERQGIEAGTIRGREP